MAANQITLVAATPAIRVTGRRGLTPPIVKSGYSRWALIERRRRISLTEWSGADPIVLAVPILFDGFADGDSVEPACSQLERLAHPTDGSEPPLVRVIGAVPHKEKTWHVSALEWDPEPIYSRRGGYRTRQAVVVELLQAVSDDRLEQTPAAERARQAAASKAAKSGSSTAGGRVYIVRSGDTLSGIAAKELGDYRRSREIADLNEIRDPNTIRVGQRLRLP